MIMPEVAESPSPHPFLPPLFLVPIYAVLLTEVFYARCLLLTQLMPSLCSQVCLKLCSGKLSWVLYHSVSQLSPRIFTLRMWLCLALSPIALHSQSLMEMPRRGLLLEISRLSDVSATSEPPSPQATCLLCTSPATLQPKLTPLSLYTKARCGIPRLESDCPRCRETHLMSRHQQMHISREAQAMARNSGGGRDAQSDQSKTVQPQGCSQQRQGLETSNLPAKMPHEYLTAINI